MTGKSVGANRVRIGSLVATPEAATTSGTGSISVGGRRTKALLALSAAYHRDRQEEGDDKEEARYISTLYIQPNTRGGAITSK